MRVYPRAIVRLKILIKINRMSVSSKLMIYHNLITFFHPIHNLT